MLQDYLFTIYPTGAAVYDGFEHLMTHVQEDRGLVWHLYCDERTR